MKVTLFLISVGTRRLGATWQAPVVPVSLPRPVWLSAFPFMGCMEDHRGGLGNTFVEHPGYTATLLPQVILEHKQAQTWGSRQATHWWIPADLALESSANPAASGFRILRFRDKSSMISW